MLNVYDVVGLEETFKLHQSLAPIQIRLFRKGKTMNTAKLRMQGNEQLAILPDGFQLVGEEVYIKKVGNAIMLIPKNNPWQTLWNSLDLFSDDFMETREQPPLQEREKLFL